MIAHQAVSQREHLSVRELLPFFINGTLSELENARVTRHVASCASCHAERDEQRRLMELMHAAPERAGDAQAAWARLERALDAESRARAQDRRVRPAWIWSIGLAAAAAMVLLLTRIVLIDPDSSTNDYRTLTSATPASPTGSGTIRAVFVPQATLGDIENLLDRARCQIISGPSPRGVYTLAPSGTKAGAPHDALAALRASPLVALAEPIGEARVER